MIEHIIQWRATSHPLAAVTESDEPYRVDIVGDPDVHCEISSAKPKATARVEPRWHPRPCGSSTRSRYVNDAPPGLFELAGHPNDAAASCF